MISYLGISIHDDFFIQVGSMSLQLPSSKHSRQFGPSIIKLEFLHSKRIVWPIPQLTFGFKTRPFGNGLFKWQLIAITWKQKLGWRMKISINSWDYSIIARMVLQVSTHLYLHRLVVYQTNAHFEHIFELHLRHINGNPIDKCNVLCLHTNGKLPKHIH